MKKFKNFLVEIGFSNVRGATYIRPVNDIVHVVELKKDRHTKNIYVSLRVTHRNFWQGRVGVDFLDYDETPVGGWIGKMGVDGERAALLIEEPTFSCFKHITADYFSYFFSRHDLEIALLSLREMRSYRGDCELAGEKVIFPNIREELPCTIQRKVIRRREGFERAVDQILMPHFASFGFLRVEHLKYARRRSNNLEFFDCCSIVFDELGTFFHLKFFPWSFRFRGINSVLQDGFPELIEFIEPNAERGRWVFDSDGFIGGQGFKADDFLRTGIDRSEAVVDEFEFIDRISENGNSVAQYLRPSFNAWMTKELLKGDG